MAETSFDVVVIGGGPAGYVAAIRAAQLGLSVACVERDKLGGVCLNWGCIPTKTLLAGAEFYHRLKHDAPDWGIHADNIRHDWQKVIARSRQVAGNLNKGIGALFKKHKIAHFAGSARITAAPTSPAAPGKVEVLKPAPGSESSWSVAANTAATAASQIEATLSAKHIVIATGAVARQLPGAEFDGERILSAREAMSLPEQPKSLVIIGAGAIGIEFAYFYNAFGTRVTVVEMVDRILPIEDSEISKTLERSLKKIGIEFRTCHKTLQVNKTGDGVEVNIAPSGEPEKVETLKADRLLVAIGVRGRFEGLLGGDLPGRVEVVKDHIKADRQRYQTSVPGIYAVGDVNGPPWLAHVAMEEAVNCIEGIAGHKPHDIDYNAIPGCTYCVPQVASVGQTEDALKAKGLKPGEDYKVGKFPFSANGKAQALDATEGFVKIISGTKYGEILGVHMIGENVTELLAEVGLALKLEATAEELIATMHAHPTLSEAVHEATLGTQARMLHF